MAPKLDLSGSAREGTSEDRAFSGNQDERTAKDRDDGFPALISLRSDPFFEFFENEAVVLFLLMRYTRVVGV